MDDFFYNKEIFIYIYGEYTDEHLIDREGYTLLETNEPIMVDIQPYSSEKAKADYGYSIETTKRIFMDIMEEIKENCIIKYKTQLYTIQKIVDWDDYLDIMLLETKVKIDG